MFYTFLPYIVWSLLHWNSQGQVSYSVAARPVSVNGDTLIRRQVENRMQQHLEAAQPEKCYLHTDRTLYCPGETLWFNAYLRSAGNLQPAASSQVLYVNLYGPNGNAVDQRTLYVAEGTAPGDFVFQQAWPGGIYKIKAWTNWMSNTQDTIVKNITLQKTVLPNLNMRLEFDRKSYGPGEEAVARVDIQGLDNQFLANEKLFFTADANGEQFTSGETQTDAIGRAYVRVKLPENLSSTDGLLNVQVMYKGQFEAVSRSIPIVLNQVDLQFFPEGGDAVAGFPCRMAFKAVNEFGKAADVSGEITGDDGAVVGTFTSYHNGMGAFELVPNGGTIQYHARITQPFRSEKTYLLPKVVAEGVALRLQKRDDKNLIFNVLASRKQTLYLTGTAQDNLFFYKEITASPEGGNTIVPVADLPPGIVRITLFDADLKERAERLVFVNREKGLNVDIQSDKTNYLPKEKVNLSILVKDDKGRPVSGRFSLAVSDETNLSYAADKQAHILSALLLEQDLKGKVEEPNFYFDTKESKSQQALDYLMMTQGWRRFVWKDVLEGQKPNYVNAAEREGMTGRVFHRNGKPAVHQKVTLKPKGPSTRTDNNGEFNFYGIDVQQYQHLRIDDLDFRISGLNNLYLRQPVVVHIPNLTDGTTFLTGKVTDPDPVSGGELIGASVKVLSRNAIIRSTTTDVNGDFRIPLNPGIYDVEISYTGYNIKQVQNMVILEGELNILNIELSTSAITSVEVIEGYKVDLVRADQTAGGKTLTPDQLKHLPTRSVNAIIGRTAGQTSIDGGAVVIKGSRSNATNYYIDGTRVSGTIPPVEVGYTTMDKVVRAAPESRLDVVEMVSFTIPIIRADITATGKTFTAEQIQPSSFKKSDLGFNDYKAPKFDLQINARRFSRAREFYVPHYHSRDTSKYYPTTLYWNPTIITDKNGAANVSFVTSDAISNFRASLEGIGDNGLPGRGEHLFYTEKPLSLDAKTPPYIISGDTLQLQLAVTNKSQNTVTGTIAFQAPGHFTPLFSKEQALIVAAGATAVFPAAFAIGRDTLHANPTVYFQFVTENSIKEVYTATIPTIERGFPVQQVTGSNSPATVCDLSIINPVKGSISAILTAYPSTLEEVLQGMDRMLRQPSGCFEQVSSSNYPNLLVLDLLKSTGSIAPETEEKARKYLADGYQRLIGYECKSGGFDWYGHPPGHEGLTAYGILEFCDMKKVFAVDQGLIDRSVTWLKTRRDRKGGWLNRNNALHNWNSSEVSGAYIVWAMSEAGFGQEIMPEINAAYTKAMATGDLYQIALLTNTLLTINDPRAEELVQMLIEKQEKNGSWMGKTESMVGSTGAQLRIETTALAILALLKAEKSVEKAIPFIAGSKNAFGYGNTQSTVLALKALVEYAKSSNQEAQSGNFIVQVDGKTVAEQAFSKKTTGNIVIRGLEQYFTNDHPSIAVLFGDKKMVIPYDLELRYVTLAPLNDPDCPLAFDVSFLGGLKSALPLRVGETIRMTATLRNISSTAFASPVMVLGIPAGLSLQPWQLQQIMEQKRCDYYEIRDGMAVFYFRGIGAGETRTIALDLRADISGSFDAPASQAFLYYSNEQRVWKKPERVMIYD